VVQYTPVFVAQNWPEDAFKVLAGNINFALSDRVTNHAFPDCEPVQVQVLGEDSLVEALVVKLIKGKQIGRMHRNRCVPVCFCPSAAFFM
jgi:hypothetical protein